MNYGRSGVGKMWRVRCFGLTYGDVKLFSLPENKCKTLF